MPLTAKGSEIMGAMKSKYGEEKGESVFYASKNKGTIEGVDQMSGITTPTPTAGVSPSVTAGAAPITMPTPTTGAPVTPTPDEGAEGASRTQDPPNWAMDKQPAVIMARDQARMAGAKDDWSPEAREAAAKARAAGGHSGGGGPPHNAQTKGRSLTPEEMHENIEHAKKAYANHPYYSGKTGPEGGQFGSVYSKPRKE